MFDNAITKRIDAFLDMHPDMTKYNYITITYTLNEFRSDLQAYLSYIEQMLNKIYQCTTLKN